MIKAIQMTMLLMSFLYLIIIAILFFVKKSVANTDTAIFKRMIFANIISILLELALYMITFTTLLTTKIGMNIFLFISKVFVVVIISWFAYMAKYTYLLSNKILNLEKKDDKVALKPLRKVNIFLNAAELIVLFLRVDFIIMKDGNGYTSGPATMFAFVLIILSCIIMGFFLLKSRKKIARKEFVPIIILLVMMVVSTMIQASNQQLLLFNPVMVLVMTIMFHTIENPDIKMIEQLEILKDQADKANNAKSEFLSSMSHEIRTPLNAIVGFSESLKEDNLPEAVMEKVDDIIMASNNLLDIVNGILDISKIEANKLEIVEKEYEIEELWNELIILTKSRIGDRGIDFRVNIDPTIPKVLYGDNIRLKQVILNVLTNAAKYTKEGYVAFNVSSVIKNGFVKLIIAVEDSGIGIKEENLPRLFSRFDRLSVEKNFTIEGTGLGLAITKKLVELMGGKIVVQSVYGKGSKFTIIIDQKIVSNEVQHQKETVESTSKVIDIKGARILLVDDNELNIKVATTLLKKYDLNIDSCTNGFDCIEKINSGNQYDLILLDDMMPRMSGKETLTKLKQINNFNIPVVALTANAIEGMKEEYLKSGFNDYLSKPIEKKEIERVLRTYLANRQINSTNTANAESTNSIIPENIITNLNGSNAINISPKAEEVGNNAEENIELPSLKTEENKKGRVLVVDDNELNIKVAYDLLSKYVNAVDCVNSGAACLTKIIEDNDYDLILMDDMMPELDGPTTMDNLRDIEGFNIPVILLTANEFDSTVESIIDNHHFAGYLDKPINKDELVKILTKYIK